VPLRRREVIASDAEAQDAPPPPALDSSCVTASVESVAAMFFNSRVSHWEPILEPLQVACVAAALDDAAPQSAPLAPAPGPGPGVEWVDVLPPAGRASAYARSASGRPRRTLSLRMSPLELVASHAMVSKLSAASSALQAAVARDSASLQRQNHPSTAGLGISASSTAKAIDWDLSVAAESARVLSAPRSDPLVLKCSNSLLPPEAFPIQVRNF
jgi:hypothetical protein